MNESQTVQMFKSLSNLSSIKKLSFYAINLNTKSVASEMESTIKSFKFLVKLKFNNCSLVDYST